MGLIVGRESQGEMGVVNLYKTPILFLKFAPIQKNEYIINLA